MGTPTPSPFGTLLITGLLAILGTVAGGLIKGYWDTSLADKKFQTDLVMKALEAEDLQGRTDALGFMIETGLIADPAIRAGLEQYLAHKPETLPRFRPPIQGILPGVVVPRTAENAARTDFSVFVCDAAWDTPAGKAAAGRVIAALTESGNTGQVTLKAWQLYDEIPLERLRGKLTLVVDTDQGEATEVPRLQRVLRAAGLRELQLVANPGRPTPWHISLITCPGG